MGLELTGGKELSVVLSQEEWIERIPPDIAGAIMQLVPYARSLEAALDEIYRLSSDGDIAPEKLLYCRLESWFQNAFQKKCAVDWVEHGGNGGVIPGKLQLNVVDARQFSAIEYPDFYLRGKPWDSYTHRRPGYNIYVDWLTLLEPNLKCLLIQEKLQNTLELVEWWPARWTGPLLVKHGCRLHLGETGDNRYTNWDGSWQEFGAQAMPIPDDLRNQLVALAQRVQYLGPDNWIETQDAWRAHYHESATPLVNAWLHSIRCPPATSAVLMYPRFEQENLPTEVCLTWNIEGTHQLQEGTFDFCATLGKRTLVYERECGC